MRRLVASLGLGAYLALMPMVSQTAHAATLPIPVANPFPWGQCTWWAHSVRPDIGTAIWDGSMSNVLVKNFNAANWTLIADAARLKTGSVPVQGAIVVYQPFVQGAAATGHVARVLAVDPDGLHFTVDETNFPGLGVLDTRESWLQPGVTFIY